VTLRGAEGPELPHPISCLWAKCGEAQHIIIIIKIKIKNQIFVFHIIKMWHLHQREAQVKPKAIHGLNVLTGYII
jgi:hypothetical protein